MKLLYPLTKDSAFSTTNLPDWLQRVRSFLEVNGEDLVSLTIAEDIVKETGLSLFMVETSLKLFGDFVLRKDEAELKGECFNKKFVSLLNDRASQDSWEIYLRVGEPL